MPPAASRLAVAPVCFLALASGCSDVFGTTDPHQPGTALGYYQLTANGDSSSSCVEVMAAAPKPWQFSVTLRRDGTTGFWIASDTPVVGRIDDQGTLTFHSETRVLVHGVDKANEIGPCTVLRSDDFTGKLAGSPTDPQGVVAFAGALRYGYSISPGSDCRDVVGSASSGGVDGKKVIFGALPCDAKFNVTATRVGEPPQRR